MGALIDSSVLIEAERGKFSLAEISAQNPGEPLAMSAVTASELLHGVHCSAKASQRAKRLAFIEDLLTTVPVVPFDLAVARVHAELWAKLRKQGKSISQLDSIISATALAWDYTVVTCDRRSFPRVPGLRVELVNTR